MEKWAEVRVLFHREALTQREIARRLGISRDMVKGALESEEPSKYERAPASTSFDPFRAHVMGVLRDYPQMPVTVLAQRIGRPTSITNLRRHVLLVRPFLAPVGPADRLEYAAGDQCQ